jgi:hypothetical protein
MYVYGMFQEIARELLDDNQLIEMHLLFKTQI